MTKTEPLFTTIHPPAVADPRLQLRQLTMPLALLAIVAFFQLASHSIFLGPHNVSQLAVEISITAVLALGMLLIILPSHIDLAAGSGVGLFGGLAAVLVFQHDWPAPLALLASAVAAMGVWWAMGSIIVRERVPAFIITLAGMLAFRGVHLLVISDATVYVARGGQSNLYSLVGTYYVPPGVGWVLFGIVIVAIAAASFAAHRRAAQVGHADGERTFLTAFVAAQLIFLFVLVCNLNRGIPLPAVILAAVAVATYVLTRHTPFGRYLYAIGGNEEAAVISGIPVAATTIGAFVIMGLIVAVTGFLQTSYFGATTTTIGLDMELDAIAACVIGGVSLKGGRGSVGGVLLGATVMAALLNGLTLMNVGPEKKMIARGVVLALAAWADVKLGKK
jgi:D-xylose transport system permease protein